MPASAGENTCNLQAKTLESQVKIPAKRRQKQLQMPEKIPAQSQAKNLQFHAKLPAIAGNLLSHRGYIHLQIAGELACIMQVKLPATYVLH